MVGRLYWNFEEMEQQGTDVKGLSQANPKVCGTFQCRLEGYTEIAFYVPQGQKHLRVMISSLTCFNGVVRWAACKGLNSTG